jgi:hypothetical protein
MAPRHGWLRAGPYESAFPVREAARLEATAASFRGLKNKIGEARGFPGEGCMVGGGQVGVRG